MCSRIVADLNRGILLQKVVYVEWWNLHSVDLGYRFIISCKLQNSKIMIAIVCLLLKAQKEIMKASSLFYAHTYISDTFLLEPKHHHPKTNLNKYLLKMHINLKFIVYKEEKKVITVTEMRFVFSASTFKEPKFLKDGSRIL